MNKSASRELDSYNEALYSDKIRKELINYEPKRSHRFLVEFPNASFFSIQKIDKPKVANGKWEDIEIEFLDLISPSSTKLIVDLLGITNKQSLFDKFLRKPIFNFKIIALDPVGTAVEEWEVFVKKFKSIDFGRYDYSDDRLSSVRVVVEPKICRLNN